jgi:hypothetical protein
MCSKLESDVVISVELYSANIISKVTSMIDTLQVAKETSNLKNIFFDSKAGTCKLHFKNSVSLEELNFTKNEIKEKLSGVEFKLT